MSSTSSSPPSKAKRPAGGIQGSRPQPLIVSAAAAETGQPSKKPRVSGGGETGPVIVYELTPRVVHARQDEFMAVVQKLTGKQSTATATAPVPVPPQPWAPTVPLLHQAARGRSGNTVVGPATDPLELALGQQHRTAPPAIDGHPAPPPPSPAVASFLLSPSSLFFSPTTIQAIQELSALF
ncbi:hypothetical protein ABZP36_002403 [Zizania latifolia]